MSETVNYNRQNAFLYAAEWAYKRNPLFYNFTGIGGDCTNFISQCVFAGSCQMNYTDTFGWYYISVNSRAPAWTGVDFFYNFITGNEGIGPFGYETNAGGLDIGDVIQLADNTNTFYHTLLVSGFTPRSYLVSAHSNDAFDRPLNTYTYYRARYIHIEGVRREEGNSGDCFNGLISGREL